ncbi:H-NS family nucleoid-associated regulatory protein [Paraburkholderia sp. BR14320]|uniref:H-NS histone family protein n=1 Tax=unclassified Paraburkholderia TaxID=2615204 RepID=UPI0034CFD402
MRDAVDAQLAAMRDAMRDEKLAEAKALIAEFGFTAYELGLVKTQHIERHAKEERTFGPKAKAPTRPPLYRDPASGATWSGRGRPPRWIEGNADEFLITGAKERFHRDDTDGST